MARLLICDDAAFMRLTLKKIVEEAGHHVVAEAEDGAECIQRYREWAPDLILMDITMPDMDGITATKKIREIDPDAKVIIVSAMGQQSMVFEAIQAGAKDFVVKPFQAERIVQCIDRYVS